MMISALYSAVVLGTGAVVGTVATSQPACSNSGAIRYIPKATFFAPDATRARGILVTSGLGRTAVADVRPECLPLPIRLNNPGALKTPIAGPWAGQVGKDGKGHAIFDSVGSGIAAWTLWVQRRMHEGRNTSFKLMSMYAPPDDCVGSVKKVKKGSGESVCPPGFPLNPTRQYADRVAMAAHKGSDDVLFSSPPTCKSNRDALFAMLEAVMRFENGAFCGKNGCSVDRHLFETVLDAQSLGTTC